MRRGEGFLFLVRPEYKHNLLLVEVWPAVSQLAKSCMVLWDIRVTLMKTQDSKCKWFASKAQLLGQASHETFHFPYSIGS